MRRYNDNQIMFVDVVFAVVVIVDVNKGGDGGESSCTYLY